MDVVLVEDHLAYRESFAIALHELSSFRVVGQASAAREAYPLVESLCPALVVVDFMLADTDAISLTRELRRRRITTPVLILGRLGHPLFLRAALKEGVVGYALKEEPLPELIEAMNRVARREQYLSARLEARLRNPQPDGRLEQLSSREREVFCRLVEGLSSKEIARALCLSSKTVDAHRLHINRKLGVRSPAELARLAVDQGLTS